MRKPLIVLAALLVVSFAIIMAIPWGAPAEDSFISVCEGGGSLWAAENRLADSCIYEIKDGEITGVLRCSRVEDGKLSELVSVSYGSNAVVVSQVTPESGEWQLLTLDEKGKLYPAATLPYMDGCTLLDFNLEGGMAYLTVLYEDDSVSVLSSIDYLSGSWETKLKQAAPAVGRVEDAYFRGDTLYILYDGGSAAAVTGKGTSSISVSDLPGDPALPEGLKTSLLVRTVCKMPICIFALCLLLLIFLPVLVMSYSARRSDSFVLRTTAAVVGVLTIFGLLFCGTVCYEAAALLSVAVLPRLLVRLAIGLVLFIAVCCAVILLMLRRSTLPIRELSQRMDRVADGDYSVKALPDRRDEVGDMFRALQELCLSLSIRDYEVQSTMHSYHRFVPRGLEELLDRASVMEVSLGDNRAIDGIAAMISVVNSQSMRVLLSDDDYISFIDKSSALMDGAIRSHNGLLLSSGQSMESNKVYFSEGAQSAVKAAIDLVGNAGAMPSSPEAPAPKIFILLHKTVLLYGIAGSDENLFPYLSSSELEALGVIASPMRDAGVQIVMTDKFMEQLGDGCVTRYIGFIAGDDEGETFKLYELLDPYSDIERNLRLSYDAQLQEAINMFYKSDFYLARNIFSSIVRTCPSDGIARWYLFACEYFFHNSDEGKADFRLFGAKFE